MNRAIIIAAAKVIVDHNNWSLLGEHGGTIQLGNKMGRYSHDRDELC